MDQLKKNLFWIILAVVVLGALGAWFSLSPDLDEAKTDALKKAKDLQTAANLAKKPDGLKTPLHKNAADNYVKKLEYEKKALVETVSQWADFSNKRLNARYTDAPPAARPVDFDNWMDAQRKRLSKKLTDAGVAFSQTEFDAKLFFGVNTDAELSKRAVDLNSKASVRHHDYQLRILAIMEDVVDSLVPRTGTMAITKFETDPVKPEPVDTAPTGALSFVSFTFHAPTETATSIEKGYENALLKSGYTKPTAAAAKPGEGAFNGALLPVSVTSIDVEFISHISAVPTIIRRLEGSEKYLAAVSKVDCERVSAVFPGPLGDTKIQQDYAKAAFNPMINTHFGEGPVKAYVTLEFYEFDKAKAEMLDAQPPAPKTAPKAAPKANPK